MCPYITSKIIMNVIAIWKFSPLIPLWVPICSLIYAKVILREEIFFGGYFLLPVGAC